jgi:signal transduction histidine kinase
MIDWKGKKRIIAGVLLGSILLLAPLFSRLHLWRKDDIREAEKALLHSWIHRAEALSLLLAEQSRKPVPDFSSDISSLKKKLDRLDAALAYYREGRAVFWTHPDVPPLQPAKAGENLYLHYGNKHLLALSEKTLFGFLRLAEGSGPEEEARAATRKPEADVLFFKEENAHGQGFRWNNRTYFGYQVVNIHQHYGFSELLLGLWWLALFALMLWLRAPFNIGLWLVSVGLILMKADNVLFGIDPAFSTFCGPSAVALGPVISSASALWSASLLAMATSLLLNREGKGGRFFPFKVLRQLKPARGMLLRFLYLPFTTFLIEVFSETVQNSTVPLNPASLQLWNFYSVLLFGALLIFLLAWNRLSQSAVHSWRLLWNQRKSRWITEIGISFLFSLMIWPPLIVLAATGISVFIVFLYEGLKLSLDTTRSRVIQALLMALIAGTPLRLAHVQKIKDFMALKAPDLSTSVDPDVNYVFQSLSQELNPPGQTLSLRDVNLTLRRIQAANKQLFSIRAAVFDPRLKTPLLYDAAGPTDYEYFQNRILLSGHETSTPGLYRITRPGSSAFYVGRILQTSAVYPRLVMLEIVPRNTAIHFAGNYRPGLLTTPIYQGVPAYAYAIVKDSLLLESGGLFDYTAVLAAAPWKSCEGPCFFKAEGFRHFVWPSGSRQYTLVSVPLDNVYGVFSFFALIFLVVLASEGFSTIYVTYKSEGMKALWYNFKFRIRLAIVGLLTLFFLLSLIGTLVFLGQRIEEKNKNQLQEKVAAVLIDLEDNLEGKIKDPVQEKQFLDFELTRLAELIFSDINFFNASGQLIATSNPSLLEDGVVYPLMPPKVIKALRRSSAAITILRDVSGDKSYYAGYGSVVDNKNRLLGYVQVPFVGRQTQYEQELSATVNTLFNAYAAALSLLLTLSIFLINSATVPLIKISQKLRSLRYGKTSEPLEYPGKDEIGRLVEEYNRLAAELEKSAAELSRRERESAWKDVARQVAHEIKNPLTPMKLGVQYLERAWHEDRENFPEKLSRFKEILINQIEALDRIATDFSAYAQIGAPRPEVVALQPLLESVCGLFSEGNPTVRVICETHPPDLKAFVDREQILRVLNNLVKNAVQSIPDGREGRVKVEAQKSGAFIRIRVEDNGAGISPEQQEKIFTPYFTTKSGGTGIGLSLCKNLVENNGGRVWFQSTPGQGSIFFVEVPAA